MKNILLLDDDSRFRDIVRLSCSNLECRIVQCATLKEAEVEAFSGKLDLMIVDGQLPDGNGRDFMRTLRSRGANIPAIFISAHLHDGESFKSLVSEIPNTLVLQKPISVDVLREQIKHILQNQGDSCDGEIDLAVEMAEMRHQYVLDAPERLLSVRRAIHRLCQRQGTAADLDAAIKESHMLRGTAGIYGLDEFGCRMGRIEDLLTVLMCAVNSDCASSSTWQVVLDEIDIAERLLLAESVRQDKFTKRMGNLVSNGCVVLLSRDMAFSRRIEMLLSADGFLIYTFRDCNFVDVIVDKLFPKAIIIDSSFDEDFLELRQMLAGDTKGLGIPFIFMREDSVQCLPVSGIEPLMAIMLDKQCSNIQIAQAVKDISQKAVRLVA